MLRHGFLYGAIVYGGRENTSRLCSCALPTGSEQCIRKRIGLLFRAFGGYQQPYEVLSVIFGLAT